MMNRHTIFKAFKTRWALLLLAVFFLQTATSLADDYPNIQPSVLFTTSDGETSEDETFSGSAPIMANFYANPTDVTGWEAHYEWRIYRDSDTDPYIIRYDENTEINFSESGLHRAILYAKFTRGDETIEVNSEESPFSLTVSESNLQMPNAFSPNGDGINDIYKAKDGYQSLTEFHAYIFNRWGQKLYEWSDPAGGWDGTFHGKPVKDGVYFCLVKAKGADGKTYNIKKDVNLLRGYIESGSVSE